MIPFLSIDRKMLSRSLKIGCLWMIFVLSISITAFALKDLLLIMIKEYYDNGVWEMDGENHLYCEEAHGECPTSLVKIVQLNIREI